MKVVNKIVNKIGVDKLLHGSVACALTSLSMMYGLPFAIFISFLITILGIFKEYRDSKVDWKDVLANEIGVSIAWLNYLISWLII